MTFEVDKSKSAPAIRHGESGTWDQEKIDYLTDLYKNTTLSSSQMQAAMNQRFGTTWSRNAIIGKIGRLGLRPPQPTGLVKSTRNPVGKRASPQRKSAFQKPAAPPANGDSNIAKLFTAPIEDVGPADAVSQSVDIDGLRDGVCKWPLGEFLAKPPFMYCGGRALPGRPYCIHHARKAVDPIRNARTRNHGQKQT